MKTYTKEEKDQYWKDKGYVKEDGEFISSTTKPGRKMKIVFHGDRGSFTVKVGRFLKKVFPSFVLISLWDGYKSRIFIDRTGEK